MFATVTLGNNPYSCAAEDRALPQTQLRYSTRSGGGVKPLKLVSNPSREEFRQRTRPRCCPRGGTAGASSSSQHPYRCPYLCFCSIRSSSMPELDPKLLVSSKVPLPPPLSPIFLQASLSPSPPPLHFLHHSPLPLLSTFAVVHLNMPAGIHKLKHHVISIAMGHLTGNKVQLHEGGEFWLHTHFISGQRFKETTPFPPSPRRRRKRAPLRGGGLHNGPLDVTVARASLTRSRERCRFAPLF